MPAAEARLNAFVSVRNDAVERKVGLAATVCMHA